MNVHISKYVAQIMYNKSFWETNYNFQFNFNVLYHDANIILRCCTGIFCGGRLWAFCVNSSVFQTKNRHANLFFPWIYLFSIINQWIQLSVTFFYAISFHCISLERRVPFYLNVKSNDWSFQISDNVNEMFQFAVLPASHSLIDLGKYLLIWKIDDNRYCAKMESCSKSLLDLAKAFLNSSSGLPRLIDVQI